MNNVNAGHVEVFEEYLCNAFMIVFGPIDRNRKKDGVFVSRFRDAQLFE